MPPKQQDIGKAFPPVRKVTSTKPPEKQPAEKKVTRGSAAAAVEAPATRTSQRASTKQPAAAAPAAKGKTPGRGAGVSRKTKREAGPQFLASFELNGETYAVGDDVYIIETDTPSELPHDEEHDLCCVCGGSNTKGMIECMRCLGGFHMRCLKPALKKVPEGDWMCPGCEKGAVLPNRRLRTAADKYLWSNILSLGHITAVVQNRCGDDSIEFACQYYVKPEETHMGRQKHNSTREVFLTTTEHWEPVECILWKAAVCKPQDMDEHEGNDIYMCEYVYDETYKRFVRRSYKEVGAAGATAGLADSEDSEWAASDDDGSDSDNEVKDRNYKPIYAFWAERGMLKGGLPSSYKCMGAAAAGRRMAANRTGAAAGAGATGAAALAANHASRRGAAGAATMRPAGEHDEVDALAGALLQGHGATSVPVRGPVSPFAAARQALALAAVPSELPCRDGEKTRISKFIEDCISSGSESPGVMYICGIPGTGKTACIMEVLSKLKTRAVAAGVQLVTLNALSLPTPQHVYAKLWERLSGQRCGAARALAALEANLAARQQQQGVGTSAGAGTSGRAAAGTGTGAGAGAFGRSGAAGAGAGARAGAGAGAVGMTLLVVDEIDVLMTKDQSVLYNLFEWPTAPGARLAVIGISNTHDLDSRVLPRIASRLASSKLAFQPYSMEQLRTIANSRLQGVTVFKPLAVEFAARKVASTSGDVRRVLELLRRAVDVAEEEVARDKAQGRPSPPSLEGYVTQGHVSRATQEVYGSAHMQFLRSCSLMEKALMVALMLEMRASKKAVASVQALHHRLETHLGLLMPEARCCEGTVVSLAAGLAAKGLISCTQPWHHIRTKVQFKVDVSDVATAFKEDTRLSPVHGQMSA